MAKRKAKTSAQTQPHEAQDIDMFQSPESSNILGASYSSQTGDLVIGYQDKKVSGSEAHYWEYKGVSLTHWQGFKAAPSKGKYKNQVILPTYGRGRKLE